MHTRRLPLNLPRSLLLLGLAALASPAVADAQSAARVPRLCYLTFDEETVSKARFAGFFDALSDLGYIDGRSITINHLSAQGQHDRFPVLAADCVRWRPTIIVATTTPAAQAAKNATTKIPIAMQVLGEPVGTGLVKSLAQPGGNITGTTFLTTGLVAKRLELLKELLPAVSRILVVTYLTDPISRPQVDELQKAAPVLGIRLVVRDIRTVDDFQAAFETGARAGAEALFTTTASIFHVHRSRVIELADKYRLPSSHGVIGLVDAGGLMAYYPKRQPLFARTADYVDRILKGAKPADLAVWEPAQFELAINLRAAGALGLTIPPSLLLRADYVINQ